MSLRPNGLQKWRRFCNSADPPPTWPNRRQIPVDKKKSQTHRAAKFPFTVISWSYSGWFRSFHNNIRSFPGHFQSFTDNLSVIYDRYFFWWAPTGITTYWPFVNSNSYHKYLQYIFMWTSPTKENQKETWSNSTIQHTSVEEPRRRARR